jgi:hypothetical protein
MAKFFIERRWTVRVTDRLGATQHVCDCSYEDSEEGRKQAIKRMEELERDWRKWGDK